MRNKGETSVSCVRRFKRISRSPKTRLASILAPQKTWMKIMPMVVPFSELL